MKIKAYYLSLLKDTPKSGFWDYAFVDMMLEGLVEKVEVDTIPIDDVAIVIIPGRSHAGKETAVNQEIQKINKCVLFIMGDEESIFDLDQIKHKNIKIWVQNPSPKLDSEYRRIGCGYPPKIREITESPEKTIDWFFSGQMTHSRRYYCVNQLRKLDNGYMLTSDHFTGGLSQDEYYQKMLSAKVVPCPSGPVTPDTFRLFEALELGCVPIADNETRTSDWSGFWEWLFDGPVPFPCINDYDDLPGYIDDCVKQYPALNNECQSWWLRKQSDYKRQIMKDADIQPESITAIVTVSVIPSHPQTDILEETINSIRHHLPDSEIIIMFDGVRTEQKELEANYNEHIRRVLNKCRFWGNVRPYICKEHLHQSGMIKKIIDDIQTPLLMFIEQDTPVVIDEKIDFSFIEKSILDGQSNLIRLHHEGVIPEEHLHLMLGALNDKLMKTIQWSSRPHVASVAFYRRIMDTYFSANSNCFTEDLLHGKVQDSFQKDGMLGWEQWKIHIYTPDKKNIKRSYHLDGRNGGKKYEKNQVF